MAESLIRSEEYIIKQFQFEETALSAMHNFTRDISIPEEYIIVSAVVTHTPNDNWIYANCNFLTNGYTVNVSYYNSYSASIAGVWYVTVFFKHI